MNDNHFEQNLASDRPENRHPNVEGQRESSAFLVNDQHNGPLNGKIQLFKEDRLLDLVQLEEIEPISNQYFGQLVLDSFSQDKGLIIGRIQTRDRVNFKRSFYHNFYAPNLIKLLFKTPFLFTDEMLISRYHPNIPLTVRNPLTNEIVVGEVEFFLLSAEQKSKINNNIDNQMLDNIPNSNSNNVGNVLNNDIELRAKFIGTDFNYAIQQDFRIQFLENSMEQEHAKMHLGGEINKTLLNNSEFQIFAQQLLRTQQNNLGPRAMWTQIQHRKKTICFHGAILCFYIIAAITTFALGIYGFSQLGKDSDSNNAVGSKIGASNNSSGNPIDVKQSSKSQDNSEDEARMNFNIFTYTLPFVAFILDHSTKRIKNLNEKTIFVFIKVILIIYYLGAYVLALQNLDSEIYFIICNVNFIVFPIITAIYGYFLRKNTFA